MQQKLIRFEDKLAADLKVMAVERGTSETQLVNDAVSLLRDYHYSKTKATVLNDEVISIIKASYRMAENTINNKTNRVLSEVAIQVCIQNQILAKSLEVSKADLNKYRLRALEVLKDTQRIWKLDELLDE